jgi:hypothetical protein
VIEEVPMAARRLSPLVLGLAVLSLPDAALGLRCDTNPGGPEEIQLVLQAAGSDIDVGYKDNAHNVGVPAGSSIRVCLADCDTQTDPSCTISGTIEGVTSGTTTIGPPLPIYVDNREQPICALIQFPAPGITGTANVQTGDVSGSATLNAVVYLGACPQCSGAAQGDTGTCQGGASPGAACTTEQVTRVKARINNVLTDVDYRVSRQCLPAGLSIAISQAVTVATSVQSVGNPCPNQTTANQCGGVCGTTCSGTPANGGVHQNCCNSDNTVACFPASVDRTGSAGAPATAWPDPTYPKTSSLTLAGAFCSQGNAFINSDAGLPGPIALLWPATATWRTDSDGDGLYDELDVTCPFDADCDDDGLIDGARSGSEDLNEDGDLDPGETDPTNPDTDGDGLPDGLEKGLTAPENPAATDLGAGYFVADADPSTTTDPSNADTDGDGMLDGEEDANHNGRVDAGESNPGTPPTTTTTTLPGCTSGTECGDDDPCTEDVCTNRVCSNPALTGVDGAACEVNKASGRTLCPGTSLDSKLSAALRKALTTANTALGQIGDLTGKKRVKLLKKARKALQMVQKKVKKAAKSRKRPLPPACATELDALLARLVGLVPAS